MLEKRAARGREVGWRYRQDRGEREIDEEEDQEPRRRRMEKEPSGDEG